MPKQKYEYSFVTNDVGTGYAEKDFYDAIQHSASEGWRIVQCGPPEPQMTRPTWWFLAEREVDK